MTWILSIPIEVRLSVLFLLGCLLGGLINLGIYRLAWLPRAISPWSRPHPDAPRRRVWDRIPVIGWLGLRREAAIHGGGFWVRPMLVELFTGSALALLYWWEVAAYGLVPPRLRHAALGDMILFSPYLGPSSLTAVRHEQFVAHAILFCLMLVAFWIDIDEMTIPDGVTLPGTLAGLFLVTLWPYALLPETSIPNGPLPGQAMLTSVWLTSPCEAPPPANRPVAPPHYLSPWELPACTGWPAAVAAVAVFCLGCLALAPGRWSMRHGLRRAVRVYTARMVRERMTYGLLVLALLGSLAIVWVWWMGGVHWAGLATGLAGMAVGGGLVWIVRVLASAVLHKEAMGFGDVTLLAMIGAFLGWQAAVIVFFLAPLAAVVVGLARLIFRGEKLLPFGPFLCLAAAVTVIAWPTLWELGDRYFSLGWWLIAALIICLGLAVLLLPLVHWLVSRFRPD